MNHHSIFQNFGRQKVVASGNHVYDFLGGTTDVAFKKGWAQHAPRAGAELTPSYPPLNEHYFDWIATFSCVAAASGKFRMAELGAGWAPWLVRAALAARQRPEIVGTELVAVEADVTHFAWAKQHFIENGLGSSGHHFMHGAMAGAIGTVRFPKITNPDEDYGASMRGVAGTREFIEVPAYSIADVLSRFSGPVDFMHLDIQGAEYDVLPPAMDLLKENVRAIIIRTHISGEKHRTLAQWFLDHGWIQVMNFDRAADCQTEFGTVKFSDGFLFYRNGNPIRSPDAENAAHSLPTAAQATDPMKTLYFSNGDGGRIWSLLQKGPIELHFIGASVTAQRGGWSDRFVQFARERTGHEHFATKNAMGGVGLLFGVANYMAPKNTGVPRVVFIEFSTGDLNLGLTPIDCLRPWLEKLVARTRLDSSPTAIIHNWRADFDADDRAGVRRTYNAIAAENGIPVIANHLYADACIEADGTVRESHFRDVCHTTPMGSDAFAKHTLSCLESMFAAGTVANVDDAPGAESGSRIAFFDLPQETLAGAGRVASSYTYPGTEQVFPVIEVDPADILSFRATGMLLGVSFISGPRSCWVTLAVDGRVVRTFRCFDRNSHYERYILLPAVFALDRSLVEIRCTDTEIDFSMATKWHADFEKPRLLKFVQLAGSDLVFHSLSAS